MKWLEFIRGYISKLIICKSSVGIEASSKKYCNDLRISGVFNLSKAFFFCLPLSNSIFSVLTNLYFLCTAFQWRNCSIFAGTTGGDI